MEVLNSRKRKIFTFKLPLHIKTSLCKQCFNMINYLRQDRKKNNDLSIELWKQSNSIPINKSHRVKSGQWYSQTYGYIARALQVNTHTDLRIYTFANTSLKRDIHILQRTGFILIRKSAAIFGPRSIRKQIDLFEIFLQLFARP